jgi:hypothetical protein
MFLIIGVKVSGVMPFGRLHKHPDDYAEKSGQLWHRL